MKHFFQKKNNLTIFIHLLLLSVTLFYFWTQSRYPALDNKMFMGTRNSLTGISFDNIWPVEEGATAIQKILAGTVNWYYTNWKGMTFGLIFATLSLSLFSFISIPNLKSRWLRAILGAFIGAPLGVCTNCATPITQGFKASGLKDETSLAITLSSPSLNIIVLTILFNHFPNNLIALKIGTSVFAIFILLPLICSLFPRPKTEEFAESCDYQAPELPRTAFQNLKLCFGSILRSLLYISKTTLPFMLLAGLLGATIFEYMSLDFFLDNNFSWTKLALVSAVGTLLPVPMTFDVIFTQSLLGPQTNISFVIALLCTLGLFSLYPFMMFWKNFSPKIAISILVSVWALGVMAGGYVHWSESSLLDNFPINAYKKDPVRYISEATREHCLNRADKETCFKTIINNQVLRTKLETLCSELTLEQDKKDCANTLKISNWGVNYDKCDQLSDPQTCLNKMFSMITKKKMNHKLPCVFKGNEKDEICRDLMDLEKSRRHVRTSTCGQIKNEILKDKCFFITTISIARSNKATVEGSVKFSQNCFLIKNSSDHDQCFFKLAEFTADSRWCEKILYGSDDFKKICSLNSKIKSNDDLQNSFNCQELKDQRLQEECYLNIGDLQFQSNLILLNRLSSLGEHDGEFFDEEIQPIKENLKYKSIQEKLLFYTSKKESIEYFSHKKRNLASLPFTKDEGKVFGLNAPQIYLDDVDIFVRGYGVSSGDINNDFWQDFIIGSYQDLNMFINDQGHFTKIPLRFREKLNQDYKIKLSPINLALVDINNDGWQDLFVSNYDGNVFFVINDKNYFSKPDFIVLPRGKREWAVSATFGDFDGNGFLDLYLGNGIGGLSEYLFLASTSDENNFNEIFMNFNGTFKEQNMNDNHGVSLSVLATDFNNDDKLDLIEGNDFEISDQFYLGTGSKSGHFRRLMPNEKIIPHSTRATMSYDTADIDNDLKLETFAVDMTRGVFIPTNYCQQFSNENKAHCEKMFNTEFAIRNANINACNSYSDEKSKIVCFGVAARHLAERFNDEKLCSLIHDSLYVSKLFCRKSFQQRKFIKIDTHIENVGVKRNILLKQEPSGKFIDIAEKLNVSKSHWGWNSKFADLDNDSWQDIYAANGRFRLSEIASNVFFHNIKGKKFENETTNFGLTDFVDTSSYSYIDFDLDGDIDIISQGFVSPLRVFKNNESINQSITFSLNDLQGNRFGIGAKVYISYKENGISKRQMKELKAGGGFSSFDPSMIHFGLAQAQTIEKVEIKWITGDATIIEKVMPSGRHYIITRK